MEWNENKWDENNKYYDMYNEGKGYNNDNMNILENNMKILSRRKDWYIQKNSMINLWTAYKLKNVS